VKRSSQKNQQGDSLRSPEVNRLGAMGSILT
jgi:hypothetical protein